MAGEGEGLGQLVDLTHQNVKGTYDAGIPLSDWIANFGEKTILYNHRSCNVNGQYFTKPEVQLMISEMVSMVNYVRETMDSYLTKETLSIDNIIVDDNHKFMFKTVRVKPIILGFETFDFTYLFFLINDHIFDSNYSKLPLDMISFLNLLIDDPIKNRQLISCHYALMGDLGRNMYIQRCCEILDENTRPIRNENTIQAFVTAFNKLDQQSQGGWKELVKPVLSDSISPIRAVSDYNYDDYNRNGAESTDILRFLRHCIIHVMQNLGPSYRDITKGDIHKLITLYLPHIVLRMQEKLFNIVNYHVCAQYIPRRLPLTM